MTALHALPAGVYRWPTAAEPDAVRRDAEAAGSSFALLDTTGIADKAGFLDACAIAFDLPPWFGKNWDALADSLGDRSAGEAEVVLWCGWPDLAAGDPDAFDVALQVFAEDALRHTRLRVLLPHEPGTATPAALADVPVV